MSQIQNESQAGQTQLMAASVLCDFCALAFSASLSEEALSALAHQRDLLAQAPFATVDAQAAEELARALAPFDANGEGGGDANGAANALFHELRQDYAYLFYQVPLSGASPFESVYRTPDQTLMGPTTLEVRAAYRERGFQVPGGTSQPDDHFGTEMAFLARLFEAAAQGDDQAMDQARSFMRDHVDAFAPAFLATVRQRAHTPFYRAAASLAASALDQIGQLLEA